MSDDWLTALQHCRHNDIACVLLTIVSIEGSSPRRVGTKMLVTADATAGSIGGSDLEYQAVRRARELLVPQARVCSAQITTDHADPNTHCHQQATILFEPFPANDFSILIFGAGHVGKALVNVLSPLPCRLRWIDSRPGIFPHSLADNVATRISDDPATAVESAPAGAYYLLMSPGHEQDFQIGKAILQRADFGFFGMLGSRRKRSQFEHYLHSHDVDTSRLARQLHCPVGLTGITARQPAAIAVAIAAQLLLHRSETSLVTEH